MGDARIVLTTLIEEKLLSPGPKRLYVSYYRKRVYADLLPDGSIRYKDQIYTSPVPCALHMKRSLNPSLKTDAGWSSMYSAVSGESLKDIKDRLNIRRRGTNARSTQKEKKTPTPSPTTKERGAQTIAAKNVETAPKCSACRTQATIDVAECSACHCKTHWQCASPTLDAAPSTPWFCEKCLSGQANRILEFLQQLRRVVVERLKQQEVEVKAKNEKSETPTEGILIDDSIVKRGSSSAIASITSGSPKQLTAESHADFDKHINEDSTGNARMVVDQMSHIESEVDAENNKNSDEAAIDGNASPIADEDIGLEKEMLDKDSAGCERLTGAKTVNTSNFLMLVDQLIAEVSSKDTRTNLIANSTGATLVHLEKTRIVQLVENGRREIMAATQPEGIDDDKTDGQSDETRDGAVSCNKSEVDALIRIFDLRHQILSSQSQFERTTRTLNKRTEKHLRDAEVELMALEESRTAENAAITKAVDSLHQYSSDLTKCEQKINHGEMLLASISRRRNFIRSSNFKHQFVPSYHYCTKLMTTSSDQLLLTVLLEKLRDITESVNEWAKMERHFTKMTSKLNHSLSLMGNKRKRASDSIKPSPPSVSIAKVNFPPSRRLIERQIANYESNLESIRQNRARMRKTLLGILKIAREEHLSDEIVQITDLLYQKCRDLKAEEEEEQLRLKEESEAVAKANEVDEEEAADAFQSADDDGAFANEPEPKNQYLSKSFSKTLTTKTTSSATVGSRVPQNSEMKGISSLLRSDSDTKDNNCSSAASKSSSVDNEEDSDGELEQASRAIADISSVLPDIPSGSDSRSDMFNSSLRIDKAGSKASHGAVCSSNTMSRGLKGNDQQGTPAQQLTEEQSTEPASQDQQSFLDQALEVFSKQQQQPCLEQQRNFAQIQRKEQQQQFEKQRLMEQRRKELLRQERERQEQERLERERQDRDRLETLQHLGRQHVEIEQERREQERRELQHQEQTRREQQQQEHQRLAQQRTEQQRIDDQQSLTEQRQLEHQRLEHQRQQRLEQQCLEHHRQENQRQQEQQRKENQLQDQQRQEQQRRHREQQRMELEFQRRQQEQHRQEQERQFQRTKAPSLPQVVHPGSSHLQMLTQQHQHLQQQHVPLHQQQHSRQLQHPLYGDMSKGMIMSSGIGNQQEMYAQQAAQISMDMHDVVRHQDSSHFVATSSGNLRASPYMTSTEVARSAGQQPAPTAPRTSFYADDGQTTPLHPQDVFGSQTLAGQQRPLADHHMFTSELQPQQPDQSRAMSDHQDFMMGRPFRGLSDNIQAGMDQSDENDVDMGDWGQ
ncbi:hypothetical protein PsorP6_007463 [Peronosclerospora sorghi]|uniref:Uncharacterized protein n=1 Tax=Peronosclerospora sorghi TaxID=230839 RepID=A0ACC0WB11_9STRA|nr:hypothetical protein PsorP6_007463 [Peronosclerospora sorghi]